MHRLTLQIPFTPPFALRHNFDEEATSTQRGFWLNDTPVIVRLHQAADDAPVTAEVFSDRPLNAVEGDLLRAAETMICAQDDLADFRQAIKRDKRMMRIAEALYGLKPLRIPDLWVSLMRALLGQQISIGAARAIRKKLAQRFGPEIEVPEGTAAVLPDAQTVLGLSMDDLLSLGFSRRKVEYAHTIAQAFVDGTISPDTLRNAPADEMIRALCVLRGIGVWTAECAGIFCLGHRDLLPADDLGVQKAVAQLYGLKQDPTAKLVRQYGEKWKGWRSYAAVYLWAARRHGVLVRTTSG